MTRTFLLTPPVIRIGLVVLAFLGSVLWPSIASPDEPPRGVPDTDAAPLVFAPRDLGKPDLVLPAGTRKVGMRRRSKRIEYMKALVPLHSTPSIDLTLVSQPTIYWFLANPAERAEFSVLSDPPVPAQVGLAVAGPLEPGIQRISLADLGVKLDEDVVYQWTVRLIPAATESSGPTISGIIQRVELDGATVEEHLMAQEPLSALQLNGGPMMRARALLAAGIWYDGFDAISALIDASPERVGLRELRADLLTQVGLGEVAEFERSSER